MTGHRPVVGIWGGQHLRSAFAVVDLVRRSRANTLESPKDAGKTTGKSKTRRMPEAFAVHRRHVGRTDPAGRHERVVILIDNAPWQRGKPIDEALRDNPHLALVRLPSDSP